MSYTIIYNKQFIKVSATEYIPVVLVGCNNVYDHNSKRSRNWENIKFLLSDGIYGTAEAMLSTIENHRSDLIAHNNDWLKEYPEWDKYSDAKFGYFSGLSIGGNRTINTTYGMFRGIVTNGIKNALTVEECVINGLSVKVSNGYLSGDLSKTHGAKCLYPKTTIELMNAINELSDYYANTGASISISFNNHNDDIKHIQDCIRRLNKPTVERKMVSCNEYFVVMAESYGYIIKQLKRGFTYHSLYISMAKKFRSESRAKKYANALSDKRPNITFTVKKVVTNESILLPV